MKMIKIAKKGFNVEIYIDRDYNVDIDIDNKNITYCDGETIRNNAEIDGVTPQEWRHLNKCSTSSVSPT